MRATFADAVGALPESAQRRLTDPALAAGVEPGDIVAFAGLVRRGGERGLLVVTERRLVFAAETGGADATPLDALTLAIPRETLLIVAPGSGGRVQDEFRPQRPESFAGVAWPDALLAAHPDAPSRAPERDVGRIVLTVLVVLAVLAAVAAAALLVA